MKKALFLLLLVVSTYSSHSQVTRLYESFETSVPPAGWQAINVTGSVVWTRVTAPLTASFGSLNAKQGSAVAFIQYQAPSGEDWLISSKVTSPIGVGDSLVFWIIKQFSDGPYPYDSLIVRVSTTDSLQASFTQVAGRICVHCLPVGAPEIIWRRFSFPLTTWAGQNIFLAFQHKDTDGHGLVLDSVSVFGPNTTVGVDPTTNVTPTRFELHQNYPNPFNPVTKIQFDIPAAGFTTLKVFDATGSEVSTLVSEDLKAGKYSVDFDASQLSSGIYYYRLQSNGQIQTQKMSLVK
jgi:hypothetical protein